MQVCNTHVKIIHFHLSTTQSDGQLGQDRLLVAVLGTKLQNPGIARAVPAELQLEVPRGPLEVFFPEQLMLQVWTQSYLLRNRNKELTNYESRWI